MGNRIVLSLVVALFVIVGFVTTDAYAFPTDVKENSFLISPKETSYLVLFPSSISLNPTSGHFGITVKVTGKSFAPNSIITIKFDDATVPTNPLSIKSKKDGSFSATFSVPTTNPGTHNVSATDVFSDSDSKPFTVIPPASISLNPTSGPVATTVAVTGTNFAINSVVTIKYDGIIVATTPASVKSSATGAFSATFSIPSSTTGPHTVIASDAAANSDSKPYTVTTPAISLNPTSGFAGTTVTVTGTNFVANSAIIIKYDNNTVATTPPTITSSSSGTFSAIFAVPLSGTGVHAVTANDAFSNSDSKSFNVIPSTFTLTETTQDTNGSTITGIWTTLSQNGTRIATGFSPIQFTLNSGIQYSLLAGNSQNIVFDHWLDTGSTVNPRTVSITSNTQLTAVYGRTSISLNPTSGSAATIVTVSGKYFHSNSAITIKYDNVTVATTPSSITSSSSGSFSATFAVPSSTVGPHTVSVIDAATNPNSDSKSFNVISSTSTLTETTQDINGNTITGFWTTLSQNGTRIASGFSPVQFTLNNGAQYSLLAGNYQNTIFDHWLDTGSTVNPRTVSITSNTQLTAVYGTTTISLNPTTGPAATTVTVSGTHFAANSPITIKYNETKIAFHSNRDGNNEIYIMNADGSGQTRLTNVLQDDIDPSFAPNGAKIAFESGRDGHNQIYIMNPDGTAQTRLTNNGAFDFSPSFSPDGAKIVFHSNRDVNNEIYIMNADGSGQTRLTNNPASDQHPVFSPDGSKIAFSSDRDGNDEIYIMNKDGSGQTRLTNNAATDINPSFSSDGSKIAFSSDRDGNDEIYIMNKDGSGQTSLTNNAATDINPSFSPDGSKIAFQSDRDINYEIYVMNVSGTGQTPITNNPAVDVNPSFSSLSSLLTTNPVSITSSSSGTFSATFTVPLSTAGVHAVSSFDAASHTASKPFIVTPIATISLNPTSGPVPTSVTITGTSYAANSAITIKYDNNTVTTNPSSVASSSSGAFSATFSVPSSTLGSHTVSASDTSSHSDSQLFTVTSQASILLNPTSGLTGTTVTISGTLYAANSHITIRYDGTTVITNPSSITSSPSGAFSATFSIPSSSTGTHTVSANDAAANPNSDSKPFTITGSGSGTFHYQTVLSGFNQPVKLAFIPDNGYGVDGSGNAFVTQRTGDVTVMKYATGQFVKQSVPFVTVPNVFSAFYEEGLAGVAFPPDYNSSHLVYFYSAVQLPNGTHKIQVMRYTVTTDASQNIVAVPGSQQIILEFQDLGIGHFGGHIKFDSLGNLYIGAGDQWTSPNSQSLQTLKGKLLRITPLAAPGPDGKLYSIPSTNPFASSSDPTILKEIFSYGLRHPYSFDLDSVTGKLYVDDVGLDSTEEIDDSTSPVNFGWGKYEGPVIGNPQNLANYKNPLYYYFHADVETPGLEELIAITAGTFYNGDVYPAQYKGAYFFGDYGVGFIKALLPVEQYPPTMDPVTGVPIGQVIPVISGQQNIPIGFAVWHGEIYYTDYAGNIGKLFFN